MEDMCKGNVETSVVWSKGHLKSLAELFYFDAGEWLTSIAVASWSHGSFNRMSQ